MRTLRTFLPILLLTAGALACGDVITGPGGEARHVRAVRIGDVELVVDEGATQQVPVTLLDQRQQPFETVPEGTALEWVSSDPEIASISADGVLTAHRAGSVQVSVTLASALGRPTVRADFEIRAAVQQMELAGGDAQAAVVGTGLGEPLAVRVTSARGNAVPGVTVTFTSEAIGGEPVTTTTDAEGVARYWWTLGTTAGQHAVVATTSRLPDAFVRFTATAQPDAPHALAVARGAGQRDTVAQTLPEVAVARVADQYGNPVPQVVVRFAPAEGQGTVAAATVASDALGEAGTQWTLGRVAGAMTLTASVDGLSPVRFDATALPGAPATMEVTPASARAGTLHRQIQFTATARDAFANVVPDALFDWSAGGSIVSVTATGLVETLGTGTTTVRAALRGTALAAQAEVTVSQVVASLVATAPSDFIAGETEPMGLVARDSTGNAIPAALLGAVTWTSSDAAIATVDATGLVTGRAAGRVTIAARVGNVTGSVEVTVKRPVPVQVRVTPDTVRVGSLLREIQFTAVAPDVFGNAVPDAIIDWFDVDTVLHVGASGLVTATGNGTGRVIVSVQGTTLRDTSYVLVWQYIDSIRLGRSTEGMIPAGTKAQIHAVTYDSSGYLIERTSRRETVAWSSSNPNVATVDQLGFVTGVAEGTATITAEAGTGRATYVVTIGEAPRATLQLVSTASPSGAERLWLRDRVVVRLLDPNGNAMASQRIVWGIPSHDGALQNTMLTTDVSGYASTGWGLGEGVGEQTLTVTAPDAPGAPSLTIRATATPRPAAFTTVSGAGQRVLLGQRTAEPIVFRVTDAGGNPVPNAPVDFSFNTGERGTIEPTAEHTDSDGRIGVYLTFEAGNSVNAAVYGFGGTQYASGGASVVVVMPLDEVQGNDQEALVGQTLPQLLAVRVYDEQARPAAGRSVLWMTNDGTLEPQNGGLSDADGWATAAWTLGTVEGAQRAVAGVATTTGVYTVTFDATARTAQLSCDVEGGTVHTGTITTASTWTAAGSPHRVQGDVRIVGAKLTIEPGAVVCPGFDATWQEGRLTFSQGGWLDARGTADQRILIGSVDGDRLRWLRFEDTPADTSRLSFVVLTNLHNGITAAETHPVVFEDAHVGMVSYNGVVLNAPGSRMVRSSVSGTGRVEWGVGVILGGGTSLIDSRASSFTGPAVSAQGTGITISGSTLEGPGGALSIESELAGPGEFDVRVEGSTLTSERQTIVLYDGETRLQVRNSSILLTGTNPEDVLVRNYSTGRVDLTGNWWGSAAGPDTSKLMNWPVLYEPWLTTAPPAPGSAALRHR